MLRHTIFTQRGASLAVEGSQLLSGILGPQLIEQQNLKQVMIAKPQAFVIQGDEEEVGFSQLLQDILAGA
jgi:hypothetical protein